jgi:hypothetical protein
MSVKAMSWVWEHSGATGAARLVLLALADHAGADGGDAFPSVARLAERTKLTERGVRKALRCLVDSAEIVVEHGSGPRGTNRYRMLFTPEQGSPLNGVQVNCVPDPLNGVPKTPERGSAEPSLTVTNRPKARRRPETPAPDSLPITDSMRAWAIRNRISVLLEPETERMLDYHRANDKRFRDWTAAWRTWMTNTKRFGSPNGFAHNSDDDHLIVR